MNQDLKKAIYSEHYSRPVEPIGEEPVVEYLTEPHPWAVRIADRGLVFCDTRDEAVELANTRGDTFMDGPRKVLRLYSRFEREDGRKFARYI